MLLRIQQISSRPGFCNSVTGTHNPKHRSQMPCSSLILQDDHPADADYYFSSGEQGRCYLAPERFYSAHQTAQTGSGGDSAPGSADHQAAAARLGGAAAPAGPGGARGGGLEGLVGAG